MYETMDRNPQGRPARPRRYAELGEEPSAEGRHRPTLADELGQVGPEQLWRWLRQGWRWIAVCVALGVGGALLFAALAVPRYTVYAEILVDPANLQVMPGDIYAASAQREAQLLQVESKLRVLTSTNVLKRVVDGLSLADDTEFVGSDTPPLFTAFADQPVSSPAERKLTALRALYERVAASRDERSFVVTLAVWARDPDKAVLLSNAILIAFQDELAQAEASTAERAAGGLVERLDELKHKVAEAEAGVEDFRRANGLQSSSGELLTSQTMTQLTTQLAEARAQLITAEARFNELATAQTSGDLNLISLETPTIVALREQFAVATQQMSAQRAINGPRHPNVLGMLPQLEAIEREVALEIDRLVETARDELERARAVVASLEAESTRVRQLVSEDDAAQITLRELEREAATQGALYEAFLARAGEVSARQQISTANIRVISTAVPPKSRSYPPRTLVLLLVGIALGAALGGALACGIGLLSNWRHRRT